jgi:transposase
MYNKSCDMRKGFNGLSGLVINELGLDPLNGSVYIFINRSRNRMKMLVYEQGGFMLYYKRLEQGKFEVVSTTSGEQINLTFEDLILLIQGIKRGEIKRLKRYKRV